MITGKLYDWLKWLAQVILPAAGTLYFTLASIWGLGYGREVIGTITAVDLFLGVILGISQITAKNAIENGGELIIHPDGRRVFELSENVLDAEAIAGKREVRFRVKKALPQ